MRIDPELLNEIIPRFLKDGWQVVCLYSVLTRTTVAYCRHDFCRLKNVHAIGDRANGLVLDAFEAALKDSDVKALRPRLEHAQLLAEKDMARFGDLGGKLVRAIQSSLLRLTSSPIRSVVIASVQPTHA